MTVSETRMGHPRYTEFMTLPPVAFYSDKHTVFRVAKPSQHMTGMTQFGRALAELNIEILCANSSQAKGRVERANRTRNREYIIPLRSE